jgi:hypothetical protein
VNGSYEHKQILFGLGVRERESETGGVLFFLFLLLRHKTGSRKTHENGRLKREKISNN